MSDKYVVTTNTVCEGIVADKDERGRIILYSEDGAARTVLDDWLTFELEHESDLAAGALAEGLRLASRGSASQIASFIAKYIGELDTGWEPAAGYYDGRKVIWSNGQAQCHGMPIELMEVVDDA